MVEFIDISEQRSRNKFLLRVAKRVFPEAYAVTCLYEEDGNISHVIDESGTVIAAAWVDTDGCPEFKPLAGDHEVN